MLLPRKRNKAGFFEFTNRDGRTDELFVQMRLRNNAPQRNRTGYSRPAAGHGPKSRRPPR